MLALGEHLGLCEAAWSEVKRDSLSRTRLYVKCLAALLASSEYLEALPDARIASLGCGTDEPTLLRLLHPRSHIDAVDLSKTSLRIAHLKELFARTGRLFVRRRFGYKRERKLAKSFFTCSDAKAFLDSGREGAFDHIQCFGVLHHQAEPESFLRSIARSLKPEGTVRLMIYSHVGRKLERKLQQRYTTLWDALPLETNSVNFFVQKFLALQLKMHEIKLRIWHFCKQVARGSSVSSRFRYLGASRAGVADAFLHPSDPGLPLHELQHWLSLHRFRVAFCEAKFEDEGWFAAFGVSNATDRAFAKIVEGDKANCLLSNVTVVLRKER